MLQQMLHRQLTANTVSHNSAISACEKGKHWEEALHLLREKLCGSVAPDMVSHSVAISACEKGQHWPEALELHRRGDASAEIFPRKIRL